MGKRHKPEEIIGKMTLIRAIAALRPGMPVSTTASAKMALRELAPRWLMLDTEIKEHETVFERLVRDRAPSRVIDSSRPIGLAIPAEICALAFRRGILVFVCQCAGKPLIMLTTTTTDTIAASVEHRLQIVNDSGSNPFGGWHGRTDPAFDDVRSVGCACVRCQCTVSSSSRNAPCTAVVWSISR